MIDIDQYLKEATGPPEYVRKNLLVEKSKMWISKDSTGSARLYILHVGYQTIYLTTEEWNELKEAIGEIGESEAKVNE